MPRFSIENSIKVLQLIEKNVNNQIRCYKIIDDSMNEDILAKLQEQSKTLRRVIEILTIEPVFCHEAEMYDLEYYNVLNEEF